MHYSESRGHPAPEESYSREMNYRICQEEMPYGYTTPPPPADTGDYDQKKLEQHFEKPSRKGR